MKLILPILAAMMCVACDDKEDDTDCYHHTNIRPLDIHWSW